MASGGSSWKLGVGSWKLGVENDHSHKAPPLRWSAMYSAVRIARARIVQVQFLSACDTNGPASATKTFFASCAWQYLFRTDVDGSLPMRVTPTSWMIRPPASMP